MTRLSSVNMRAPEAQECRIPGGLMRFDPELVFEPGAYLFDATDTRNHAQEVSEGGRRAAWFVQGQFGEGVLRHYRRGGLMARLSQRHYVWAGKNTTRSFAEFNLLRFMYGQGLPVPRPVAAAWWRNGLTYRAAILVARIPDVKPLANVLDQGHHAAVAAAICAIHHAGVWHADLNAYNVLLDESGKAWLIDFDKGRVRPLLSPERRRGNLLRLRRSLVKVAGERGMVWWDELNRVYGQLDGLTQHP